jgi:hypothetical protein
MQFVDAVAVAGTRRTADGYLIAEAKAVRTGIQLYAGDEVGKPGMAKVRVYRPADQVFADASLQSFTHAPITVDHPKDSVTSENWKDLAVGEVSTAAKKDGEWVWLPLILKDAAAIKSVEDGKRELSAGYSCELDWTAGTTADGAAYDAQQKNIKINHLALVDRARAGSQARIGDGAVSWGIAPYVDQAEGKESPMADNLQTVVLGDKAVQVADKDVPIIELFKTSAATDKAKLVSDHAAVVAAKDAAIADAEKAHKAAIAAKDEEIGTLKADLKKAQDAALKPEDIDRLVADRSTLVATIKSIDSKIEIKGTDADLRRAAVKAKLGDEMVKDASDAEITGMFKAIAKDVKPADPFRDVMAGGLAHTVTDADKARQAAEDAERNAWKTKAA